jgi:hypothetical protein
VAIGIELNDKALSGFHAIGRRTFSRRRHCPTRETRIDAETATFEVRRARLPARTLAISSRLVARASSSRASRSGAHSGRLAWTLDVRPA